jgi:magnesium transporter
MAKVETIKRRAPATTRRPPIGASPGTLIADPAARRTELRLTLISPDRSKTIDNASIDDVNANCDTWPVIWLDCTGLASIPLIEEIGRIFSLHPLALEDVVNTGQRPNFFEDHAFVVVRMIDDVTAHRYEQIAVFFGRNLVVTFQEREGDPFNPVRKRIESSMPNRLRTRGADYLAYALIDAVVDSYFPPVETAGELVDSIEDQMLRAADKHQMRRLHELRRDANVLKGVLWPMRDALATLIRSDVPYVKAETKIFLERHARSFASADSTGRNSARHADRSDRDASVAEPGAHQRRHQRPDDRFGDFHPAHVHRRRRGYEFRSRELAVEHARAESLLRLPGSALVHGCCRDKPGCLLQMEEVALA